MAKSLLLSILMLFSAPLMADVENEITTLMDYFAEMWNAGDADFVSGYFHPEFILVTEDDTITRSEYVASIKSIGQRGGDRGELDYTGVKVRELGDSHAVAWGNSKLKFEDGSSLESRFSTVFAKTPFGWKALLTRN